MGHFTCGLMEACLLCVSTVSTPKFHSTSIRAFCTQETIFSPVCSDQYLYSSKLLFINSVWPTDQYIDQSSSLFYSLLPRRFYRVASKRRARLSTTIYDFYFYTPTCEGLYYIHFQNEKNEKNENLKALVDFPIFLLGSSFKSLKSLCGSFPDANDALGSYRGSTISKGKRA